MTRPPTCVKVEKFHTPLTVAKRLLRLATYWLCLDTFHDPARLTHITTKVDRLRNLPEYQEVAGVHEVPFFVRTVWFPGTVFRSYDVSGKVYSMCLIARSALRVLVFALLFPACVLGPVPAADGDVTISESSLSFLPEDAAFFMSLMHNRQQFDAVAGSQAFARLKEMPFVQSMWHGEEGAGLAMQLQMAEMFFSNPANQPLKQMLIEMVSDEVFICGGKDYLRLTAFQRAFQELAAKQMRQDARNEEKHASDGHEADTNPFGIGEDEDDNNPFGIGEDQDDPDPFGVADDIPGQADEDELWDQQASGWDPEQARMILQVLNDNVDDIVVPDTIVGFRIKDTEQAQQQLRGIEGLLQIFLGMNPQFEGRLQRQEIAGSDFLTLTLDAGALGPGVQSWEQMIRDQEQESGQFDNLLNRLKKMTLTVSLGVRQDYLLLFVGSTSDGLERLGNSKPLLESKAFAPIRDTDKTVASVYYVSDELARSLGSNDHNIKNAVELLGVTVEQSDMPAEMKQQAADDLEELGSDVVSLLPRPGAWLHMSTLTGSGYECFTYNHTTNTFLDSSRPLTILEHVGGTPVFFAAGRYRSFTGGYRVLTKWMDKLPYYLDHFAKQAEEGEDAEDYRQAKELISSLWPRLDRVTRQMLLPALEDGQVAFVLDSKLTDKQWHLMMPAAEKPLPMLEPALVLGVSDAELFKRACAEYTTLFEEIVGRVGEIAPEETELLQKENLPPLKTKTVPGEGTYYAVPPPQQAGVSRKLVPTAGLSDEFLTLAIHARHARRLLKANPPPGVTLFKDADRPLAMATFFNWSGVIRTATPWIDYVAQQMANHPLFAGGGAGITFGEDGFEDSFEQESSGAEQAEEQILGVSLEQIHTGLEISSCFRGFFSASYAEGDTLVTHSVWHFKDLK